MSKPGTIPEHREKIPFWRNERVLKVLVQIVFLILVLAVIAGALSNYLERGLTFSFSFLEEEASFDLAEGIEFSPTDPYARAFLVGVVNTIRVAALGIVLATIVGLFAGIARLSSNWLVSKIAGVYIGNCIFPLNYCLCHYSPASYHYRLAWIVSYADIPTQ